MPFTEFDRMHILPIALNGKAKLEALQKDPEVGFLNAVRICPNDEVILHRYGYALLKMSKSELNAHHKLSMLEKAEKLLTNAIELNRKTHLAKNGTRTNVYISMFDFNGKSGDKQGRQLLLKARKDGLLLMKEHFITLDHFDLANVCQYLAKFPHCQSFGKKFVQDVEYIYEALGLLNTALRVKGQTYALARRIESVLFDLGKYETATEWAKRAFLLCKTKILSNVQHICRYMLEGKSDFGDILNVLTFVFRKNKNIETITYSLTHSLIQENWGKLCNIISFLQTIPFNENQAHVAEALTKRIIRKKPSSVQLDPKIQRRKFEGTDDVPLIYTQADIAKVIKEKDHCTKENEEQCKTPTTFQYDFSAIIGKDDAWWVKCFILDQLSLKLFDDDVALKGRPLRVDHDFYSSIILNALDAAHTSRRTLFFFSVAFLERKWPLLKTCLLDILQTRPDFLILIVLDSCKIPTELAQLTCIDMENDQQIPFEIDYLKMNLFTSKFS